MVRNTLTSSFREKIRQKAEKKADGLGATRKLPVTAVGGIKNDSRAPEMPAGNEDVARLRRELELERARNAGLRAENEVLRTSLTNAASVVSGGNATEPTPMDEDEEVPDAPMQEISDEVRAAAQRFNRYERERQTKSAPF